MSNHKSRVRTEREARQPSDFFIPAVLGRTFSRKRVEKTIEDARERMKGETPSFEEELILQLEEKIIEMNPNLYPRSGPDFYTLSNEEELNWLDCQINKVNEVSLSDELEERKLDALKLLQISFGRAPDTIHADVKEWGEGVRKSLNYLDDEAYEDEIQSLSERCNQAVSTNDYAAAEQLLLQTMEMEYMAYELMPHNTLMDMRPRLTIDALVDKEDVTITTLEILDEGISLFEQQKEREIANRKLVDEKLRCMVKVKKPVLTVGIDVYAKQTPSSEWQLGTIKSCKELDQDYGYGPIREYTVHLHNSATPTDIYDYNVMDYDAYECEQEFGEESCWINVKRVHDRESKDPWAREVGWYVATYNKEEHHFAHLEDAFRAHDAAVGADSDSDEVNKFSFWDHERSISEEEMKAIQRCIVTVTNMKEIMPPGSDRRMVGDLLVLLSDSNHPLMDVEMDLDKETQRIWKLAEKYYHEGHMDLIKGVFLQLSFLVILSKESPNRLRDELRLYIRSNGSMKKYCLPGTTVGLCHDLSLSVDEMMERINNYISDDLREHCGYVLIETMHPNNITKEIQLLSKDLPLKGYLTNHAREHNTTAKYLKCEHDGSTLFLSNIGNKTPEELGIQDHSLKVSFRVNSTNEAAPEAPGRQSNNTQSKKKKKKRHKKSNKKKSVPIVLPEDEEEKLRKIHSKAISKVLAEAGPTFRQIRQRLNAMNLERTAPKKRMPKSKPNLESSTETIDIPSLYGLGGKAGKTQYVIQVGEVTNLYNTTKPSSRGSQTSSRGSAESSRIMIDLHGLTVDEAMAKLDESLPTWVEEAMQGEYPWVIPVKIVCGGGSQLLSEAVEAWIKKTGQVANAPKNLHY